MTSHLRDFKRGGMRACSTLSTWACAWFLLATCIAAMPVAHAADEESFSSSRALLQVQGKPLNLPLETFSAGGAHTCALATNGSAFCWGGNLFGQLGDGTTSINPNPTPTAVVGGTAWAQISAGNQHTCALATNGSALCWGNNGNGQLGDGTTGLGSDKPTPTAVLGGTAWAQISAGGYHTCALATNGSAFCWGQNTFGQLGDGTTSGFNPNPTPTVVVGGTAWAQISAGAYHTCALATNGSTFCWGYNGFGQLGDGTTSGSDPNPTPTAVVGGTAWVQVSAGNGHTCALATDGSAFCWGENTNGRLGDGTFVDKTTPTAVVGGTAWAQISAGESHTCALATNGSAFCWGSPSF